MTSWLALWQGVLSIEWLMPWMIAFLPLPYLIRRFWRPAPEPQTALYAPHLYSRISNTTASKIDQNQKQPSIPLLGWLIWISLILAAMRPIWYHTPTPFEASGKDMILAVDLSGSMEKNDMKVGAYPVDRLTAVKSVVHNFIRQRQGDRMGLVVFGSQAFFLSPLTYDLKALQALLDETEIAMAGNNTAIGDAIGMTVKHLPKSLEKDHKTPVLILLTDGSNTAGSVMPMDAAERAAQAGLKIYTIGIGQVHSGRGSNFFGLSSRDMDIDTLQKIADLTQGRFFLASDTQQLDEIYQTINQLEANKHQLNHYRLRTELYIWPAAFAFMLLLINALIKRYGSAVLYVLGARHD